MTRLISHPLGHYRFLPGSDRVLHVLVNACAVAKDRNRAVHDLEDMGKDLLCQETGRTQDVSSAEKD